MSREKTLMPFPLQAWLSILVIARHQHRATRSTRLTNRQGPQKVIIYNEAYAPLARNDKPLGSRFADVWPPEIVEATNPSFEKTAMLGHVGHGIAFEPGLMADHPNERQRPLRTANGFLIDMNTLKKRTSSRYRSSCNVTLTYIKVLLVEHDYCIWRERRHRGLFQYHP